MLGIADPNRRVSCSNEEANRLDSRKSDLAPDDVSVWLLIKKQNQAPERRTSRHLGVT